MGRLRLPQALAADQAALTSSGYCRNMGSPGFEPRTSPFLNKRSLLAANPVCTSAVRSPSLSYEPLGERGLKVVLNRLCSDADVEMMIDAGWQLLIAARVDLLVRTLHEERNPVAADAVGVNLMNVGLSRISFLSVMLLSGLQRYIVHCITLILVEGKECGERRSAVRRPYRVTARLVRVEAERSSRG